MLTSRKFPSVLLRWGLLISSMKRELATPLNDKEKGKSYDKSTKIKSDGPYHPPLSTSRRSETPSTQDRADIGRYEIGMDHGPKPWSRNCREYSKMQKVVNKDDSQGSSGNLVPKKMLPRWRTLLDRDWWEFLWIWSRCYHCEMQPIDVIDGVAVRANDATV